MTARAGVVVLMAISIASMTAGGAAAAPSGQETYLLGPGDAIEITVFGQPDLSHTVTIKPDGTIALPLVGEVAAAGRTTAQLEKDLTKLYLKYLRAPSISIAVREFRTSRIYVLGQVNRPGEYQLKPSAGVLELLAAAGGPTTRADLAKAVLIRGKTETQQLDLLGAIKQSKDPDVALEPGDVVYIPQTDPRIIVLGEVTHPGAYDILEGQHVTDLIAGAGGLTTKAALTRAFIVRGQEQIPVDLQKALAGDTAANIPLKPGDMMVVPESHERIAVLGAVNKPGPYDFTPNLKLVDAIALAGGQTDRANLGRVQVVRVDGTKATMVTVNVAKALSAQDPGQNIALQSGDIVYVTPKGLSLDQLGSVFNVFYVLRLLVGL